MVLMQYQVKCPVCMSTTILVTQEASPIIFECNGCGRNIVMSGNSVYTVSREFVKKIMNGYKVVGCGQVVQYKVSDESKDLITDKKIQELSRTLDQCVSIDDVLDSLK